jgi:hypothetical protein
MAPASPPNQALQLRNVLWGLCDAGHFVLGALLAPTPLLTPPQAVPKPAKGASESRSLARFGPDSAPKITIRCQLQRLVMPRPINA